MAIAFISLRTPSASPYVMFMDLAKSPAPLSTSLSTLAIMVNAPNTKLAGLSKPDMTCLPKLPIAAPSPRTLDSVNSMVLSATWSASFVSTRSPKIGILDMPRSMPPTTPSFFSMVSRCFISWSSFSLSFFCILSPSSDKPLTLAMSILS